VRAGHAAITTLPCFCFALLVFGGGGWGWGGCFAFVSCVCLSLDDGEVLFYDSTVNIYSLKIKIYEAVGTVPISNITCKDSKGY
jgi:hypothetical protein